MMRIGVALYQPDEAAHALRQYAAVSTHCPAPSRCLQ
jgi:hypothetical protein